MAHLLAVFYLPLAPVAAAVAAYGLFISDLPRQLVQIDNPAVVVVLSSLAAALAAALAAFFLGSRPEPVYLLDFACYKPKPALKSSREAFVKRSVETGQFKEESLEFQKKILERSGLGPETYFPEALVQVPAGPSMAEARKEAETVMFGAIDEVLARTKVKAEELGIVVVNCSVFSPTPSFSSMVVNRYKLREDVLSYNLAGMGCSAGLISIDLVKNLLQSHRKTYALVVSMENITLNWYAGKNPSMLVSNCIFRMGGAAIVLSNIAGDRSRSKYQLIHTVRTHKGADDRCHRCAVHEEDSEGNVGVSLSKDLVAVAGVCLRANIDALGPLVLPVKEQLLYLLSWVGLRSTTAYVPDFKSAFEHICVHAGGRGVLDGVEEKLGLSRRDMEPSRMALYRYGNTSSSSTWYELGYSEAKGRVRRGDRVWQIAFGSGFKCNSAVWRALRSICPAEEKAAAAANPWLEEIHRFPVEVPKISPISETHD